MFFCFCKLGKEDKVGVGKYISDDEGRRRNLSCAGNSLAYDLKLRRFPTCAVPVIGKCVIKLEKVEAVYFFKCFLDVFYVLKKEDSSCAIAI